MSGRLHESFQLSVPCSHSIFLSYSSTIKTTLSKRMMIQYVTVNYNSHAYGLFCCTVVLPTILAAALDGVDFRIQFTDGNGPKLRRTETRGVNRHKVELYSVVDHQRPLLCFKNRIQPILYYYMLIQREQTRQDLMMVPTQPHFWNDVIVFILGFRITPVF